jgi:pilus assembly protein CpaB
MKVLIVGIVVLALAVAGVSTYLIQSFGGDENLEELQKKAQKPKLKVLIAARDLRPGDVLIADFMEWQAWVEESINKRYVAVETEAQEKVKIKDFEGGVVRRMISEGEPMLASKIFKTDKPTFLSGVLGPGMRAVSFTAAPNTAASGFILPGDRVDILLTHDKVRAALRRSLGGKPENPEDPLMVLTNTTETIMRDIKVIAVNQLVDLIEGTTIVAKTLTLELTPKQAELMVTARTMGRLSWVLRSLQNAPGDMGGPGEGQISFTNDVEVSPVLRNFDAIVKAFYKKSRAGSAKRAAAVKAAAAAAAAAEAAAAADAADAATAASAAEAAEAADAAAATAAAAAEAAAAPPPAPVSVSVIKIYRGGAGNLQEIKGK